jgi:hypothetical protein
MDIEERIKKALKNKIGGPKASAHEIYAKHESSPEKLPPVMPWKWIAVATASAAVIAASTYGIYRGLSHSSVQSIADNSSQVSSQNSQISSNNSQLSSQTIASSDFLDQASIDSFSSYQSIGVSNKGTDSAKGRRRERILSTEGGQEYSGKYDSKMPFSFVGYANSAYSDLSFKSLKGQSVTSLYNVSSFYNFTDFYGAGIDPVSAVGQNPTYYSSIAPGSSGYNSSFNGYPMYSCAIYDIASRNNNLWIGTHAVIDNNWVSSVNNFVGNYLISKKTGSIYYLARTTVFSSLKEYQGGFYGSGLDYSDSKAYCYRLKENEESKVLSLEKLFAAEAVKKASNVDKFGTLIIDDSLMITANSTTPVALPALPDGTACSSGTLFFDELNWHYTCTYNNVYYYLDKDAKWVAYGAPFDNYETLGISPSTYSYFIYKDGNDYYFTDKTDPFSFVRFTRVDDLKYTLTKVADLPKDYSGSIVIRGHYLYYCADTKVHKVDVLTGTAVTLTFSGYTVNGFNEDGLGNIVITGYDDKLVAFTAYLDANDQITYDVGKSDYTLIYVYPV